MGCTAAVYNDNVFWLCEHVHDSRDFFGSNSALFSPSEAIRNDHPPSPRDVRNLHLPSWYRTGHPSNAAVSAEMPVIVLHESGRVPAHVSCADYPLPHRKGNFPHLGRQKQGDVCAFSL